MGDPARSEAPDDLWYLQCDKGFDACESKPFLQSGSNDQLPKLSPDGRYIAYRSYESGDREVYVREFPSGGDKVRISTNGADWAVWRKDGTELYYAEAHGRAKAIVAVPVSTGAEFSVTGPAPELLRGAAASDGFEVWADGQQFVLAEPVDPERLPFIRVVQNWLAEFEGEWQDR